MKLKKFNNIKILVATHKKAWFPDDPVYLPIQLGSNIHKNFGVLTDNTGENISNKQPYYSELTAIFWAWKNLHCDYIGLNHYRRYFVKNNILFFEDYKKYILKDDDFKAILEKTDVILPQKRNYYFINRFQHYKYQHNINDLLKCRELIKELHPEYLKYFDEEMHKCSGHICNMFVMKKEVFDDYCRWLFSILFNLENKINLKNRDEYQKRIFGYIAERLLDVWIAKNKINYIELPYVNIEGNGIAKKLLKLLCNVLYFYYRKFIK